MRQLIVLDGIASFAWKQLHEYIDKLSKDYFIVAEGGPVSKSAAAALRGFQYSYSFESFEDNAVIVSCRCSEEEWKLHTSGEYKLLARACEDVLKQLRKTKVVLVDIDLSEVSVLDAAKAAVKAALA